MPTINLLTIKGSHATYAVQRLIGSVEVSRHRAPAKKQKKCSARRVCANGHSWQRLYFLLVVAVKYKTISNCDIFSVSYKIVLHSITKHQCFSVCLQTQGSVAQTSQILFYHLTGDEVFFVGIFL